FAEASPGEYGVRWYRNGQTLLVRKFEIPAGGAADLTLTFELPKEGEVVPPLFPNAIPPGGAAAPLPIEPPRWAFPGPRSTAPGGSMKSSSLAAFALALSIAFAEEGCALAA